MLLPTIFLLTVSVAAWTVPKDFENGVYDVYLSASGEYVHTFIANITETPYVPAAPDVAPVVRKSSSAKFRRDLTGPNNIYCANANLNSGDTDSANNNIDAQCGNGATLPSAENGRDKYAIFGDVVSYVCNLSSGTNNCFASERQDADRRITADCGWYIAGDDTVPDRQITYGYQERDANFCGRGINGK